MAASTRLASAGSFSALGELTAHGLPLSMLPLGLAALAAGLEAGSLDPSHARHRLVAIGALEVDGVAGPERRGLGRRALLRALLLTGLLDLGALLLLG